MKSFSRHGSLARILAIACAAGALLVVTVGARDRGLPALLLSQAHEEERGRWLEAEWEATDARLARRARVVREVIAGRMALLEAAAYFHEMRAVLEERYPIAPRLNAHLPPAERACREVIDYIARELEHEPRKARAVVWQLEAELQEQRQRGALRLSVPRQRRAMPPRPDEVRANAPF